MKLTFVLLAVFAIVCVSAGPNHHDAVREEYIRTINQRPHMTWTAGVNTRFAGTPVHSSKSLLGVKATNKNMIEAAIATGVMERAPKVSHEQLAASPIPEEFDAATNWPACASVINDIRDQSNCGCCWAFGAVEAASDRMCIATKGVNPVVLSAQEMCFCSSRDGCGGGDTVTPWSYILSHGLTTGASQGGGSFDNKGFCSKFSLPHCHHHGPQGNDPYPAEGAAGCPSESSPKCPTSCDSSATTPHNNFKTDRFTFHGKATYYPSDVASIQTALMTDGPLETAFTVYGDFENYVSGVYQQTSTEVLGGHAVKLVGWGVDATTKVPYWKVANSWNPYWGEKGYFRIIRGKDECGIESGVTGSSAGATWGPK